MGDKSDKIDRLVRIKNRILDLVAIQITAENQQESYNVFEILNARGVDLKQYELLKNYIFKYMSPKRNVDIAKNRWAEIESMLFSKNYNYMEMFLTHYTIHKYSKPSGLNTEFKILKDKSKKDKTIELLNDLHLKATIYTWLLSESNITIDVLLNQNDINLPNSKKEIVKLQNSLYFFNSRNHRQFRPLFLSVFSKYKSGKIELNELTSFLHF